MNDSNNEIIHILRNLGFDNLFGGNSTNGGSTFSNVSVTKVETGQNEYFYVIGITSLKVNDFICRNDNTTVVRSQEAEMKIKEFEYRRKREKAKESFISLVKSYKSTLTIKFPLDKHSQDEFNFCINLLRKLEHNIMVRKADVPPSLLSKNETYEYFKYYSSNSINNETVLNPASEPTEYEKYLKKEKERLEVIQKMRSNWEAADPVASQIVSGMAYGAAAVTLAYAGKVALNAGAKYIAAVKGTDFLAYKITSNIAHQMNNNGGDWRELEVVSIIVIPFSPKVKGTLPSVVQFRPFSEDNAYQIIGDGISWEDAIINSGVKTLLETGKRATWKGSESFYPKEEKMLRYHNIDVMYKVISRGNKEKKD